MIKITHTEGPMMAMEATGKLTHEDYQRIIPAMEQTIREHGSMNCLIRIHDLGGVEPRAMLDDIKFDVKHARHFKRIALITDTRWHEWVTKAWGAVVPGCEVKCFTTGADDEALAWVRG